MTSDSDDVGITASCSRCVWSSNFQEVTGTSSEVVNDGRVQAYFQLHVFKLSIMLVFNLLIVIVVKELIIQGYRR